jgi:hypothetical protein
VFCLPTGTVYICVLSAYRNCVHLCSVYLQELCTFVFCLPTGTVYIKYISVMVLQSEVVPPVVRTVFCIVSADSKDRRFLESVNS